MFHYISENYLEVLNFCSEFTFYDHYKIDWVIESNHVRDCVISVLNKCDFIEEFEFVWVLDVADNISLMVVDGKVKNVV